MDNPPLILLLTSDPQRYEVWRQLLATSRFICVEQQPLLSGAADMPDVIVTDQLPISRTLGPAMHRIAEHEVAVLGIGTQGAADVQLPLDATGRELQVTCRLLAEIVRLRRQLAEGLRTQQALRSMAFRDPLTGLANRRQWDQDLVARLEPLQNAAPPAAAAIALLDVDHFKPINDRLGHMAGDLVLQRMAQTVAANVAPQHLVARLGGDEFGVILTGLLTPDIPEVVELLRRAMEHTVDESAEMKTRITASAGVAIMDLPLRVSPWEAVAAADQALQEAKHRGRNRTVTRTLECPSDC